MHACVLCSRVCKFIFCDWDVMEASYLEHQPGHLLQLKLTDKSNYY